MTSRPKQTKAKSKAAIEETAVLALSKLDRKKLGMDAWEPSLLLKLPAAQNCLKQRK